MKSYFPDINVWVALSYRGHVHCSPTHRDEGRGEEPITNNWPDAYLAALAQGTGLTVVTLDQDFMNYPGLEVLVLSSP